MTDPQRTRALSRLAALRDGPEHRYGQRFSAAREHELLAWALTVPDEDILALRNTGHGTLRWIREHPPQTEPIGCGLGEVMKRMGWRVELFWNGSAGWFTARTVNLDGHLVPFEDPIGASGATPDEAVANLHEAVPA